MITTIITREVILECVLRAKNITDSLKLQRNKEQERNKRYMEMNFGFLKY